ncbi:hypothetical protein GP486_004992 [Trichoglossum hirsutum]|uniref:Uncharacterized protein n=1 Tax=Trichoglossum hirsutum TaxID=265104 RepID=A0A9P8L9Y8_9PEZI|nr:hypothetical protein GP486_004992 [Trichoglossum hirsutum]
MGIPSRSQNSHASVGQTELRADVIIIDSDSEDDFEKIMSRRITRSKGEMAQRSGGHLDITIPNSVPGAKRETTRAVADPKGSENKTGGSPVVPAQKPLEYGPTLEPRTAGKHEKAGFQEAKLGKFTESKPQHNSIRESSAPNLEEQRPEQPVESLSGESRTVSEVSAGMGSVNRRANGNIKTGAKRTADRNKVARKTPDMGAIRGKKTVKEGAQPKSTSQKVKVVISEKEPNPASSHAVARKEKALGGKAPTAAKDDTVEHDEPALPFAATENPAKDSPVVAAAAKNDARAFESIRNAYAARVAIAAEKASQRASSLNSSLGAEPVSGIPTRSQDNKKGAFRAAGVCREPKKVTLSDKVTVHVFDGHREVGNKTTPQVGKIEVPQTLEAEDIRSQPEKVTDCRSTGQPPKEYEELERTPARPPSDTTRAPWTLEKRDEPKGVTNSSQGGIGSTPRPQGHGRKTETELPEKKNEPNGVTDSRHKGKELTIRPQEYGKEPTRPPEMRDTPGSPKDVTVEHRTMGQRPKEHNAVEHAAARQHSDKRRPPTSSEKRDADSRLGKFTDEGSTEHPPKAQETTAIGGLTKCPPNAQNDTETKHSPEVQKQSERTTDESVERESASDDSVVEIPPRSTDITVLEVQGIRHTVNSRVVVGSHTIDTETHWEYRVIRTTWRDEEDPPLQHHCGTYFDRESANKAARDELFPPGASFDPTFYDEYHKEKDAFGMDIYSAQSAKEHILISTERLLRNGTQATDVIDGDTKRTWMKPKVYVVWEKYTEFGVPDENDLFEESVTKSTTTTMLSIHTTRELANKAASDHTLERLRSSAMDSGRSTVQSEVKLIELQMESRKHLELLKESMGLYSSEGSVESRNELFVWVDEVDLLGPLN